MLLVKLETTRKRKGRGDAYYRCFGNRNLASILSRTQAMIIKNGTELEKMILERVNKVNDLDDHLKNNEKNGIFVVPKKIIKKSTVVEFDGVEPDFMIFIQDHKTKACHIVELKDGCDFDTKSSEAEKNHLKEFIKTNAQKLQYTFEDHICCFNETTREGIVKGFKQKITADDALTGREFCDLLQIDYEEIVSKRKADRESNLQYFLKEITTDEELSDKLTILLGKSSSA